MNPIPQSQREKLEAPFDWDPRPLAEEEMDDGEEDWFAPGCWGY